MHLQNSRLDKEWAEATLSVVEWAEAMLLVSGEWTKAVLPVSGEWTEAMLAVYRNGYRPCQHEVGRGRVKMIWEWEDAILLCYNGNFTSK